GIESIIAQVLIQSPMELIGAILRCNQNLTAGAGTELSIHSVDLDLYFVHCVQIDVEPPDVGVCAGRAAILLNNAVELKYELPGLATVDRSTVRAVCTLRARDRSYCGKEASVGGGDFSNCSGTQSGDAVGRIRLDTRGFCGNFDGSTHITH